jgi:hypothetical protein
VDAGAYDAWYRTSRGTWIGETEFQLLRKLPFDQGRLSGQVAFAACLPSREQEKNVRSSYL